MRNDFNEINKSLVIVLYMANYVLKLHFCLQILFWCYIFVA